MAWIARLIGFLLALVLGDAAFESATSLPSMLPASAGAAGLALGALVLFWARPWIACALASLALFSTFAYGSFAGNGGPALTSLPASDASAAALELGIVASVIAVWSVVRNSAVRVLVVLVALYVSIAPVASIRHGGLAASFASAPLAMTRGSYGATEVLFPLAALVALAGVFVHGFRKRGAAAAALFMFALALGAATQFGSYAAGSAGLPTIVAFEHPKLAGTTLPSMTPNTTLASAPLASANPVSPVSAVTNVATTKSPGDATPGPRFVPKDSDAVAADVAAAFPSAKDPEHALASVAALGNDVYPGALAGAAGTLRSGSGNSIDKALLLRDVLRAGSPAIETQFASCTLSDADADAFIAAAQAAKQHGKLLIQSASTLPQTSLSPDAQKVVQRWAQAWTSMVGKTKSDGARLSGALTAAGVALPPAATHDALRGAAAKHVWLQAKTGGTWTDLDPTIDAAVPGKTRCSAQSVAATLPDDDYDVLDVRVTAESLPNEQPQETVLLDRSIRTADIGDRAVSFVFAEMTGVDVPAANAPAGSIGYTPVIYVGDEGVNGTPVVLPVEVIGGAGKEASTSVNAVGSLFDSSPAPAATSAPPPIVTGIWLDFDVSSPGAQTTRVRRTIFDRLGIAVRGGVATPRPLGEQPAPEDYISLQTEWNVAVSAGHVASAIGPSNVQPAQSAAVLGNALARVNGAFYSLRRAIMDEAAGAPVEVAAARPGISVVSMNNDGELAIDSASDSSIPLTSVESRPFWATASLLAEREVVHRNAPIFAGQGAGPDTDVLAAFDQAVDSGVKFEAFHPGDSTLAADTSIPTDTRTRMSAELASGATLFALPPGTRQIGGPFGYWVIDPAAGTVRDENAEGLHAEMAEYQKTNEPAVKATPAWKRLACNVAIAIMTAVTEDSGRLEGTGVQVGVEAAEEAGAAAAKSKGGAACG